MKIKVLRDIQIVVLILLLLSMTACSGNNRQTEYVKGSGLIFEIYPLEMTGFSENYTRIISSYKDYQEFIKLKTNRYADNQRDRVAILGDHLDKEKIYYKDYFRENVLYVIYVPLGSGSLHVEYRGAVFDEKDEMVEIRYEVPPIEAGTNEMTGYLILVEGPKSVKEINVLQVGERQNY